MAEEQKKAGMSQFLKNLVDIYPTLGSQTWPDLCHNDVGGRHHLEGILN